jgi:hypothetical protein
MISVADYERKLAESEEDRKELVWLLLKATAAGAGAAMGDFGARLEELVSANDGAIAASLTGSSHSFLDEGLIAPDIADELGTHSPPTSDGSGGGGGGGSLCDEDFERSDDGGLLRALHRLCR